jgi:hypothetical protein
VSPPSGSVAASANETPAGATVTASASSTAWSAWAPSGTSSRSDSPITRSPGAKPATPDSSTVPATSPVMRAIKDWAETHIEEVAAARDAYDVRGSQ